MKISIMVKEVLVVMVFVLSRRENIVERELQEVENLKEELKKEKVSVQNMREEYTKRLVDFRYREEQVNFIVNIEKVICLLFYFKFVVLVVNIKFFKFILVQDLLEIGLFYDIKIFFVFISGFY